MNTEPSAWRLIDRLAAMADDLFAPSGAFPEVSYEDWRRRVLSEIEGETLEAIGSTTVDGIEIAPLYAAEAPRGQETPSPASLLPSGGWRIWQGHREPGGERLAGALVKELDRGLDGAWIELDSPTRRGLDADWEAAGLDVGRDGLSLTTAADVEDALDALLSRGGGVGFRAGRHPLAVAALIVAAAGGRTAEGDGTLGIDPIGALAAGAELVAGAEPALGEAAEVAVWCSRHAPRLRAVLVSATPYAAAGASEVQELAFVLATATTYLRSLEKAGIPLEAAAGQLAFRFSVGRDVYLQAAKLRAVRLLWSGFLASAGVETDGARARVHAVTAWRTKTSRDPWTNLIRNSLETLASVLGGADTVEVTPHDLIATDGRSTDDGRRLALTTQLVLREEARLGVVADALGGSWYVERLTEELAARAWEVFREIESGGGIVEALRDGTVQRRVTAASEERRRLLEGREEEIVGVGLFPPDEDDEWAEGERREGDPGEGVVEVEEGDLGEWRSRRRRAVAEHREDRGAAVFRLLGRLADDTGRPWGRRFERAVAAARAGSTLGQLVEATTPDGSDPCRVEPLVAWRDEEALVAAESRAGGGDDRQRRAER